MKEKIANFFENRKARTCVIAGGVVVILAAGAGGVLLGKPDWSPFLSEADHQTVSLDREERKAAESNRMSALNMIPSDSVMVSHANTGSLDDVNKWWKYYLGMLLSSESLPQELPKQYEVTSVTYAKVPVDSDSEYHEMYPFGDMLILTVPTDKELELRSFFGETINADWMMGTVPSEEDPSVSFVYLYSTYLGEDVEKLIQEGGSDFTEKAAANNFRIDRVSPSMLFDMSGYFNQLEGYISDPSSKEFAEKFASKGLGMDENAIWVGDTLDGGKSWGGKFLKGDIDAGNLDVEGLSQMVMEQVKFVPAEGGQSGDENSDVETGIAYFGMAGVQDGISVTTKEGTFGKITSREAGEEPAVAELGDNDATLAFSPSQLQSTYQGYLPPSELDKISIGFKGDDVTFSFD